MLLGLLGGRDPGGGNVEVVLGGGLAAPTASLVLPLPFIYKSLFLPSPGDWDIGRPGPPLGMCCFGMVLVWPSYT